MSSDDRRPRTWGEKWQLWWRRQNEDSEAFSEAVSSEVLPHVGPWAVFTQGAPSMYKAGMGFMAGLTYIIVVIALMQTGGAGALSFQQLAMLEMALPYVAALTALIGGYVFIYLQFAIKTKIWRQVEPAVIRNPDTNEVFTTILRIMGRPRRVWTPTPEAIADRLRTQRKALEEQAAPAAAEGAHIS